MKRLSTFLICSLIFMGMTGFTSLDNEKLTAKITLIASDGVTRILDISDMTALDWNEEISTIEFFHENQEVDVNAVVVFSPMNGDAIIVVAADKEGFVHAFKKIQSDFNHVPGDRVIIDNLKEKSTKRTFTPLVYSTRK